MKAEHRSGIPGIVHGASTSGASLFLEPLSTVEINNDIVALEEQEAEEVQRILLALTDAFRARAARPAADDRGGDRARRACRRAPGSRSRSTASSRRSSTDGAFELLAARHPLLKHAGAGHDQDHAAGDRAAHHRTEHRRQDRRAQDRGAARADGAGRPADSGRRRIAAAGVPLDLRRHRRRAVDRREPEHLLGAHHEHRVDGSRPGRCRRWSCSTRSAPAPIRSKAARSASPSSITSAGAARRSSRRATTTR